MPMCAYIYERVRENFPHGFGPMNVLGVEVVVLGRAGKCWTESVASRAVRKDVALLQEYDARRCKYRKLKPKSSYGAFELSWNVYEKQT